MNVPTYLAMRGWREEGNQKEARWWPPSWLTTALQVPHHMTTADKLQSEADAESVAEHGSVRFVPTVDQARTSPLCKALASQGVTEHDAIEQLFRESNGRAAQMSTLTKMSPRDAIALGNAAAMAYERDRWKVVAEACDVALGDAKDETKAAQAREAAWKAYAKALKLGGVAAMNARKKALAALEALGIDPEAP